LVFLSGFWSATCGAIAFLAGGALDIRQNGGGLIRTWADRQSTKPTRPLGPQGSWGNVMADWAVVVAILLVGAILLGFHLESHLAICCDGFAIVRSEDAGAQSPI
jgi:hypothetical protein